jgi:hypothetical protein
MREVFDAVDVTAYADEELREAAFGLYRKGIGWRRRRHPARRWR